MITRSTKGIAMLICIGGLFASLAFGYADDRIAKADNKENNISEKLERGHPNADFNDGFLAITPNCRLTILDVPCVGMIEGMKPTATSTCATAAEIVITMTSIAYNSGQSNGADGCAGAVYDVLWTFSDGCSVFNATCVETFRLSPAAVSIICPGNMSVACMNQSEINTAYDTWLGTVMSSGGCNVTISNNSAGAPNACGGVSTVMFTAADGDCGTVVPATCTATFTVITPTALSLTCPTNMTLSACQTQSSAQDQFEAWLATAVASNGCSPVVTNNSGGTAPLICTGGVATVTFTATDQCGGLQTCIQTFTVTAPTTLAITNCPANTSEAACQTQIDINNSFSTWLNSFAFEGGCNSTVTTTPANPTAPTICTGGFTQVTWTVTDATCNVAVSCSGIFMINAPPSVEITCPPTATVECGNSTLPAATGTATYTSGCETVVVTYADTEVLGCGDTKTITRTWTATERCGDIDVCIQIINVVDTTDPTITCPAPIVGLTCGTTIPAPATTIAAFRTLGGTATDGCSTNFTVSSVDNLSAASFSFCAADGPFIVTRTYTVSDECGNSSTCDQIISYVPDVTAPIITCPTAVTGLTCNSVLPAGATTAATFIAQGGTINENCNGAITVSFVDDIAPSTFNFCAGGQLVVTRTYTIMDACGNTSNCNQTFTYAPDITPPSINCAVVNDLVVECGSTTMAVQIQAWITTTEAALLATATDNCGGLTVRTNYIAGSLPSLSCDASSGLTVTFMVEDGCLNMVDCTAQIIIDDTTDPLMDCSVINDLTIECGSNIVASINNWIATTQAAILNSAATIDLCDPSLIIGNNYNGTSIPTLSCNGQAGLQVTFTLQDDCGNTAPSCVANVFLDDNVAPIINCPTPIGGLTCGSAVPVAATTVAEFIQQGGSIADACNQNITVSSFDNVNPASFSFCATDGPFVVTRTYTVTDGCGNANTCNQTITYVADVTGPSITCPPAVTGLTCTSVLPGGATSAAAFIAQGGTINDNCGGNTTVTFSDNINPNTFSFCAGGSLVVTRTYTVTDGCGNPSICNQTFTYTPDTTPPTVNCGVVNNLVLECGATNMAAQIQSWLTNTGAALLATATDNCGGLTVRNSYLLGALPSLSCDASTGLLVTFIVEDGCNNRMECVASIIIDDTTDPLMDCSVIADLTVECGSNAISAINIWIATTQAAILNSAATQDLCDPTLIISNNYNGSAVPTLSCNGQGGIQVTFSLADDCGNMAPSCIGNIFLDDNVAPTISCPGPMAGLTCGTPIPTAATTIAEFNSLGGFVLDACNLNLTISSVDDINPASFSFCLADGPFIVTRTYTATDGCGNANTCTQTFTYAADVTAPVVTCPPSMTGLTCTSALPAGATNAAAFIALGGTISNNCTSGTTVSFVDDINPSTFNFCTGGGLVVTRTYTITDGCNNVSNCNQTFTYVPDTTPPTINCAVVNNLVLECGTTNIDAQIQAWLSSTEATLLATSTDNCGGLKVRNNYSLFTLVGVSCDATTGLPITFIVEDGCNNPATCIAQIIFDDTTDPLMDCSVINDLTVECGANAVNLINSWIATTQAAILNSPATQDLCDPSLTISNNYDGSAVPTLSCNGQGGIQVTFSLTDDCGNMAPTCVGNIFLDDNVAPSIICPGPVGGLTCGMPIPTAATTIAEFNTLGGRVSDACSVNLTISSVDNINPASFSFCAADGPFNVTRTYTVTDGCGNANTCTQIFTYVADATGPVITCPPAVTGLTCTGVLPAGATNSATFIALGGTISNNCTSATTVSFVDDIDPSTFNFCAGGGLVVTRTYTVTDGCGNESTCVQTFSYVPDTTPPTVNCAVVQDIRIECNSEDIPGQIQTWLTNTGNALLAASSDNCGAITVRNNYIPGTLPMVNCGNALGLLVTFMVEDGCLNMRDCTAQIILMDSTDPVFTSIPASIANLTCKDIAMIPALPTTLAEFVAQSGSGTDNCSSVLLFSASDDVDPNTFDFCSTGAPLVVTRTFELEDMCGNKEQATQTFTFVPDTQGPTFTSVPANIAGLTCNDVSMVPAIPTTLGQFVAMTGSGTDNCSNTLLFRSSDNVDVSTLDFCSMNGPVVVTRTFELEDECGNVSDTTQTFTFMPDTQAPIFTSVPAGVTGLTCNDTGMIPMLPTTLAEFVAMTGSGTDNCSANLTFRASDDKDPSSLEFCTSNVPIVITRTFELEDACGNVADATQTFTFVPDTEAPTIISCLPDSMMVSCTETLPAPVTTFAQFIAMTGSGTDNCTAALDLWIVGVDDKDVEDLTFCAADGPPVITRTYYVTDACSNSASCTQTFTFPIDMEGPDIVCMDDTLVNDANECFSTEGPKVPTATDACGRGIDTIYAIQKIDTLGVGIHMITWVAKDNCGNSSECTQTVTVRDTESPTIVCRQDTLCLFLRLDGLLEIPKSAIVDTVIDNCGEIASVLVRRMENTAWSETLLFDCADVGNYIMVVTEAIDTAGNANQCMSVIEIKDKVAPALYCPPDRTINCEFPLDLANMDTLGRVVETPAEVRPGRDGETSDACGIASIEELTPIDSGFDCTSRDIVRTIVRTFVVTDVNGNTNSCTQTISIIDEDPFDGDEDIVWLKDVEVGCSEDYSKEALGSPTITADNCSQVLINSEDVVFQYGGEGCKQIMRIWRVMDWCYFDLATDEGVWRDTQIITVVSDILPSFNETYEDRVVCADECTQGRFLFTFSGTPGCGDDTGPVGYIYKIDLEDGAVIQSTGNTIDRVFPMGEHKITLSVIDGCNQINTTSFNINVRDCKAPSIVCIQGIAISLMDATPGPMIEIWASDFDQLTMDNCSSMEEITFTFSPDLTDLNKTFTCSDLGRQELMIYATDAHGNQSQCNTYIIVQDNQKFCPEGTTTDTDSGDADDNTETTSDNLLATVGGRIWTTGGEGIKNTEVSIEAKEMTDKQMTPETGLYAFESLDMYDDYMLRPKKDDDPLNGVSTLDIVMIQKHILGLKQIEDPYLLIAADTDKSNRVSATDLIELRKMILGEKETFSNNESWRFIDAEYELDMFNPWNFPEEIEHFNLEKDQTSTDFIGIKIGDVSGNASAGLHINNVERRTSQSIELNIASTDYKISEMVDVNVIASENLILSGMQMEFEVDAALEVLDVATAAMPVEDFHYHIERNHVSISWNTEVDIKLYKGDVIFSLLTKARKGGNTAQAFVPVTDRIATEAYNADLDVFDIDIKSGEAESVIAELYQNSPNPFSETTEISFSIPESSEATLIAYNVKGEVLYRNTAVYPAGLNSIVLTKGELNNANGVIYYRLDVGEFSAVKTMMALD